MIHSILKDRPTKLLLGFTAFFCCNALIADAIGTKLFSLEKFSACGRPIGRFSGRAGWASR
jgi:hypothetical protein